MGVGWGGGAEYVCVLVGGLSLCVCVGGGGGVGGQGRVEKAGLVILSQWFIFYA